MTCIPFEYRPKGKGQSAVIHPVYINFRGPEHSPKKTGEDQIKLNSSVEDFKSKSERRKSLKRGSSGRDRLTNILGYIKH